MSKHQLNAMHKGMAYCPEDRKVEGIIADLSVRENMILALQAKRGMFKLMSRKEQEELTEAFLNELHEKYSPERVVIEYNGMWKVSDFEALSLPQGWEIEQKLTTVDASTFQMYLNNLKPLFVEMVRGAELVLFNRCTDIEPLAGYRRSVKVVSPQAEVIFEDETVRSRIFRG